MWWCYPLIMLSVFVPLVSVYAYENRKERLREGTGPCMRLIDEAVYCADFLGHSDPCGLGHVFVVSEGMAYDDE